jgi:hypothetical protein
VFMGGNGLKVLVTECYDTNKESYHIWVKYVTSACKP